MSGQEPGKEQEPETIISQTESPDSEKEKDEKNHNLNQNQQKWRPKSGAKGKLVRSLAVCEESSPNAFDDDFPDNQELTHLHEFNFSSLQEGDKHLKNDCEKGKDRSKDKAFEKTKARIHLKVHFFITICMLESAPVPNFDGW
ncbi:hypothetical protein GDO86_011470 [Hymenochirus boettgeri]|uniref:Uncharacterized protein n=1 Tax=Hymenochirus boettgeri TaxID=247094 RepID=A0A8T2JBW1_9PIPI|nr:hypothetical protein GDO86_011470 [Hymenochirus boettgeri]